MTAKDEPQRSPADGTANAGARGPIDHVDHVDHVDHSAFNLLQAMQLPGSRCPVCHLVLKGVDGYLEGISYESVNDPATRQELRKSLGYCAAHGQEWLRLQDTLGTAIIYHDVLSYALGVLQAHGLLSNHAAGHAAGRAEDAQDKVDTRTGAEKEGMLAKLQKALFGKSRIGSDVGRRLAVKLGPSAPCPVCRYTLKMEKDMAEAFAGALAHTEFMEAYRRHEVGLCLPHFRKVLMLVTHVSLFNSLVDAQEARLEKTLADLSEVVRKYDYRNTGEARGEEFRVPARSVEQAGGSLPTQLNLPGGKAHNSTSGSGYK